MEVVSFTDLFTGGGAVSAAVALGLIILAGLTSMITASFGVGGGVMLLATMATVVPVAALIPVHGLVQLGSNGSRSWLTRSHIDWAMVKWFSGGALAGAVAASFIVVQLPLITIQFTVAGFILFLVWGPKPAKRELSKTGRCIAGALTTVATMFVGATGPLVAGFVHRNTDNKMTLTSTFATCMTFQHLLKAFVFSFAGFAFFQWLPLVVAMVVSGFTGTWLGLKVLKKVSDERFALLFKVIVTILALRLIWQAVMSL
ncbi:sulfite exporter TauE/SafE family protein [Alteromonas sp. RKMC-009]|nr:sulfite exporter TauE/SafE family protein [Alteromonas sp. RKMC-009]